MLLLDFDGVLVDSRDEVVVTSYRCLTQKPVTSIAELPISFVQRMRRFRPIAGPADEIIPLAQWCLESPEELIYGVLLDRLCETHPLDKKGRAARFFSARAQFFASDRAKWFDIHNIYEPFVSTVKALAAQCVVLTNKNKQPTLDLLGHFKVPFDASRVYAGDNGVTKSENLEKIVAHFNQRSFLFFDDHAGVITDLMDSLPEGVSVVPHLALWGFGDPAHNELAQERGYKMVTQEQAATIIKSYRAL